MEEIKCPYCGNVQVTKSNKGKYVYHCPFCNGDFDLESHLSIENNNKDRYLKAGFTHIQNGNLGYALEMLNRLELEFPFDKEVQALRKAYNAALIKEEERIRIESEARVYLARKEEVNNQISSFDKDNAFWGSENGTIDKNKLITAFKLLDKAEEYEIECPSFRAKMWSFFNDTNNGRRRLLNTQYNDEHRFYNLFCLAVDIWDLKIELSQTQKELKQTEHEYTSKIEKNLNEGLIGGIAIIIIAIVMIIIKHKSPDISKWFWLIGSLGGIMLLATVIYILMYNSKSKFVSFFMFNRNKYEKLEKEIKEDISEIEEEIKENHNSYDVLLKEYAHLTFDKSILWMKEHKDLLLDKE